tara:strand:+ start:4814 stop:4984 length:171 start_codon:yes stop_codon:yes gene_type:complete
MNHIGLLVVFFLVFLYSCSGEKKEVSVIKEKKQELEIATSYKEAYDALEDGDPYFP